MDRAVKFNCRDGRRAGIAARKCLCFQSGRVKIQDTKGRQPRVPVPGLASRSCSVGDKSATEIRRHPKSAQMLADHPVGCPGIGSMFQPEKTFTDLDGGPA